MGWKVVALICPIHVLLGAKTGSQDSSVHWEVGDVTSSERWIENFDLVVEIHILQAIPAEIREEAANVLPTFLKPKAV